MRVIKAHHAGGDGHHVDSTFQITLEDTLFGAGSRHARTPQLNLPTLICTYTNTTEVAPEPLTALIYMSFRLYLSILNDLRFADTFDITDAQPLCDSRICIH